MGLCGTRLPVLLNVRPVLDWLEDPPKLGVEGGQSLILGADIGIEFVNVIEIETALRAFCQVLIFGERGIQRLQNAPIIDEQTIFLLLMQPVHAGNGLDKIVLFELLVDVEDSVARLIEFGEQLVDHNEDVGSALGRTITWRS